MKKSNLISFCLVSVFISACVTNTQSIVKPETKSTKENQREMLVGKFLGEMKSDEGKLQKWLVERAIDGTYQITFRIYENEIDFKEQIEVGYWGIAGPIYFSIMKGWIKEGEFVEADPRNPYFYDAYKVINVSENEFVYEHFEPKILFKIKRVQPDFSF